MASTLTMLPSLRQFVGGWVKTATPALRHARIVTVAGVARSSGFQFRSGRRGLGGSPYHDAGFAVDRLAQTPLDRTNVDGLRHWEVAADAIVVALASKGYFSVDELRRAIENLPGPLYERYGYYGRWSAAACAILVSKNKLSVAALADALWGSDVQVKIKTWAPGDAVRVLREDLRTRWATPHLRVPGYIFGCEGVRGPSIFAKDFKKLASTLYLCHQS